jgi:hypothetical protein
MPAEDDPLREILAQLARERVGTVPGEDVQMAPQVFPSGAPAPRLPAFGPGWAEYPPRPPRGPMPKRNPKTFVQALLRSLGVLPPVIPMTPRRDVAPPTLARRVFEPAPPPRGFAAEQRREG